MQKYALELWNSLSIETYGGHSWYWNQWQISFWARETDHRSLIWVIFESFCIEKMVIVWVSLNPKIGPLSLKLKDSCLVNALKSWFWWWGQTTWRQQWHSKLSSRIYLPKYTMYVTFACKCWPVPFEHIQSNHISLNPKGLDWAIISKHCHVTCIWKIRYDSIVRPWKHKGAKSLMCWCTERKKERKKQRNLVKFKKASGTGLIKKLSENQRPCFALA